MLAQLPPPVHGAAVMNQIVAQSGLLAGKFELVVEPIAAVYKLEDLRRFRWSKTWRAAKLLFKVVHHLWGARSPELVYLTFAPSGYAFFRDCAIVLLCRLAGVPHVLHLHGRGIGAFVGNAAGRRTLARLAFAEAFVILLGERLSVEVADFVSRSRIRLVPNGIDDPAAARAEPGGHADERVDECPVVLFVSNMLREKGPVILLEALASVAKRGIQFRAVLAGAWRGDLTEQEFWTIVRRLGLEDLVVHRGPVYGDEKRALFEDASVFVFPTYYRNEAMPLVLLEAMAFGLPTISTSIGLIPDVIRDGEVGMIVPPGDADALAHSIACLLCDKAGQRAMGAAARRAFEGSYTRAHFEGALVNALEDCYRAAHENWQPSASRAEAPL